MSHGLTGLGLVGEVKAGILLQGRQPTHDAVGQGKWRRPGESVVSQVGHTYNGS